MNLRNSPFGNAGIYLVASLVNAGIPFLLLPILTRVLSPVDYGTVAMFTIVLSVLGAFTGLSVHGAVGVRYFQLEKAELADYVGTCVGILMFSTAVVFVLVALLGQPLAQWTGVPSDWLLVAVVLSGCQFFANLRLSLWQVSGDAKRYGAFQISQSLFNAAVSLFLVLMLGMAWKGRVLGQTVAGMVFGLLALWWLRSAGLLQFSPAWRKHARDALAFGVPLIPHVVGGLLLVAADRLIIVGMLDLAHAGVYMVALQVGQVLGLLTESFNKAYAPWLMKNLSKPTEALRVWLVRGTYLYFVVVFVAATAFGLLAPMLLNILVGESFRDAAGTVLYVSLGLAFGGCYFMVTNYIFFENRTNLLAWITFFSGLVNIALMFILIDRNGIVGAGQAFMLTQAVSFFGTWWLAHQVHPMPWLKAIGRFTSPGYK